MQIRVRVIFLLVFAFAGIGAVFSLEPLPQSLAYHAFADKRALLGISNFWNVASNLPFLMIGALGFLRVRRNKASHLGSSARQAYLAFFVGVFFTGFGSAYYHWVPDNASLVWDRLPMSVAFMGLFAAIWCERINEKWGRLSLIPLVTVGCTSVFYWFWSELQGAGDLRFYAVVQLLPLILIPLILLMFPARFTRGYDFMIAVFLYGAAKLAETFDYAFYDSAIIFSGHTAKHFVAAVAIYWLLRMLRLRTAKDFE